MKQLRVNKRAMPVKDNQACPIKPYLLEAISNSNKANNFIPVRFINKDNPNYFYNIYKAWLEKPSFEDNNGKPYYKE